MGLKSNQKVDCCFHNIYATIEPVDISSQTSYYWLFQGSKQIRWMATISLWGLCTAHSMNIWVCLKFPDWYKHRFSWSTTHIVSYHQVLNDSQEHWQWPIMFENLWHPVAINLKEESPFLWLSVLWRYVMTSQSILIILNNYI